MLKQHTTSVNSIILTFVLTCTGEDALLDFGGVAASLLAMIISHTPKQSVSEESFFEEN